LRLSNVLQEQLLLQDHQQQQLGLLKQESCNNPFSNATAADTPHCSSSGWPPLEHVSITGGCSVANLAKLLHSCQQLQHLQLDGLGPLGNEVAAVLASKARQLKVLQLSGCSSMGVQGCSMLAAGLQQLQQLELVDVSLPASHLMALLQGLGAGLNPSQSGSSSSSSSSSNSSCRRLKHLKVERCRGVTNDVIASGVAKLQYLQELQLVACDGISGSAALLRLIEQLPQLAVLEVVGCKGVADAGFAWCCEAAAAARVRDVPGSRVAVQRVVWQS
jgi:hypothetical protein